MSSTAKAIVLDSWAIIAYLEDEPAAERIADSIAEAQESNTPLMMTVINLGEVWYIIARQASAGEADRSLKELLELGIEVFDADWELTRQASYFKSRYRMSYADCFAAALAREKKAHLITGDKEFKQVEREVFVMWV